MPYFRGTLKAILLKHKWFFLPYLVFLAIGAGFLLSVDRITSHKILNEYMYDPVDNFFAYITHVGDGLFIAGVFVGLLFVSFRGALIVGLSSAIAGAITGLLKNFVFPEVHRPYFMFKHFIHDYDLNLVLTDAQMHIHYSFPSGHSTGTFACVVSLMLFVNRPKLGAVFFTFAFLSAYSRVYLSQHFFQDIYVGSLIGSIMALLIFSVFQKWKDVKWLDKSLIRFKN